MKKLTARDFEDLLQVCNASFIMPDPSPLTSKISVQSLPLKDCFWRRTTISSWIYYSNLEHGTCLQIYIYTQNQPFVPLRILQLDWARGFTSLKPPLVAHMRPMHYCQRRQLEGIAQQLQEQKSTTMPHLKMLKIWQRGQKCSGSKRCSICQPTRFTPLETTLKQSGYLAPRMGSLCRW